MPPRTRTRVAKGLKENVTTDSKPQIKTSKLTRKALADKTNSLSDNNTPIETVNTTSKTNKVPSKITVIENCRPRRERRLPPRYVQNQLLKNLSNSTHCVVTIAESPIIRRDNNSSATQTKLETKIINVKNDERKNKISHENKITQKLPGISSKDTPSKVNQSSDSPYKTPKNVESVFINRPKRIHRLPSRFDDHSMSPSKFVPIRPIFASTPLQQKESKSNKNIEKKTSYNKCSPGTGDKPKKARAAKLKVDFKKFFSPPQPSSKSNSHVLKTIRNKRLLNKSNSFEVLKEKINENHCDIDVYEFTYDPEEEPAPQKKKRKRVAKKKSPKPKFLVFKNNYEQNVGKTMVSLKKVVAKKTAISPNKQKSSMSDEQKAVSNKKSKVKYDQCNKILTEQNILSENNPTLQQNKQQTEINTSGKPENDKLDTKLTTNQKPSTIDTILKTTCDNAKNSGSRTNVALIRIEDIAADFELRENNEDLNYSPVNLPNILETSNNKSVSDNINNLDPLNLCNHTSFFNEQPVASSSINTSIRHPLASPWRVEFENLPIKWQVNTYVKPNMTPAVESSFISSKDDSKKKHVYTNMLLLTNETQPELVENNISHFKQTSIISFIKEVAERNASKKKRTISVTPTKASLLFEDITNIPMIKNKNSLQEILNKDNAVIQNKKSDDKENSRNTRKRKNKNDIKSVPRKSPYRQKDKNVTYFGFDDSEIQSNENISPQKIDPNVRALRPRARTVLQEINNQVKPMRAHLPLAMKSKMITSSEVVNKVYEDMKSAQVAPTIEPVLHENIVNTDSNSVHLFEDIELIHHLKPMRKSYGKAKKVTFRQHSGSDDDEDAQDSDGAHNPELSDIDDLTFTMPAMSKKKPNKKKKKTKSQLSSKEKKEVEDWAAGFNSMCEDIEEFPLVVE